MKSRKLTLLSGTLLVALVTGALLINVLWAPKTLKLKVKWKPVDYVLDNPIPDPWNAEIWLIGDYDIDEIDPTSLVLEGMYEPVSDPYEAEDRPRLVVPFDGYDVLYAVLLKAGHLAPGGEYRVWLEMTGEAVDKKTQQRTPFEGKGGISLIVPENSPP